MDTELNEGAQLRDAGIQQVTENAGMWMPAAYAAVRLLRWRYRPGALVTGEDIKNALLEAGIATPHHPNCWGALTRHMLRCGAIRDAHITTRARNPAAHAHRLPVWEVINLGLVVVSSPRKKGKEDANGNP